jgi:hypothetical protein
VADHQSGAGAVPHTPIGWRDDPIVDPDQDRLERVPFASHAAALIAGNHSPESSVVYGLEGPWGSGKSSIIALVTHELEIGSDWRVVHFTPWATSGTEGLFAEFFSALSLAVPDTSGDSRIRDRLLLYADIARPIAAAIPVFGASVAEASRTLEERLRKPWNVAFAEVSQDLKRLDVSILVVVDDIDRLQSNELLDLLKVVRLLGRFPGVDFLLAYDERTVVETLQDPRRGSVTTARARAFMEKIVQYPLVMPPLLTSKIVRMPDVGLTEIVTPERVEATFDKNRFGQLILNTFPSQLTTPRAIRRFLAQVQQQFRMHDIEEMNDVDLILATFLRVQFPDLFTKLQRWKAELTMGSAAWVVTLRGKDEPPKWDDLLTCVEGADRADARAVLEALFPVVRDHRAGRADARRFAHPDYFDRYLAQAIPEGDIADSVISTALGDAASGSGAALRSLLLGPEDEQVSLALTKIRARYPDVTEWRGQTDQQGPISVHLLATGAELLDELQDRRASWTSGFEQTTYWLASVIRTPLDQDPNADLTDALARCTQLERRARLIAACASGLDQLKAPTQEAVGREMQAISDELIEPLLADLRARDASAGLAGSPFLYWIIEEGGRLDAMREAVRASLVANEFTLADVAARFVGFAYMVGGSGIVPSSASFSGDAFTRLTDVPARSTDDSEHGAWPDTAWARRREFASAFVGDTAVPADVTS